MQATLKSNELIKNETISAQHPTVRFVAQQLIGTLKDDKTKGKALALFTCALQISCVCLCVP